MSETKQEVATKTATPGKRIITVVATRGEKVKLEFEGSKWSELKKILEKGGVCLDDEGKPTKRFSGYDLSNMKCVESFRKNTLEHVDAVIPEDNFNLFLMPLKSKSGGTLSRTEAYAKIKGFIGENSEKAKAHFSDGAKNYTQINTEKLNELIESYKPGTKVAVAKEKAAAISDVVSSVKAAKASGDTEDIRANLAGLTTDEKVDIIIELLLGIKAESAASPVAEEKTAEATVTSKPEAAKAPEETPQQKEARLKKEADDKEAERKAEEKRKEDKRLEDEMNEMMGGLDMRR